MLYLMVVYTFPLNSHITYYGISLILFFHHGKFFLNF